MEKEIKGTFNDKLVIKVNKKNVSFHCSIDHAGNTFKIERKILKEMLG